jgi:hypothetical protein
MNRCFDRWALLAVIAAAGCAAPPLYEPTLSHMEIPVAAAPDAHVQLLVSLRAVAADRARHLPAGMEARIRVDNDANRHAILDPGALELVALDLTSFEPATVSPPDGLDVSPGESGVVVARFAYPHGESATTDGLRAVDLRWTVAVGDRQLSNGLTFHRVEAAPTLYDPWFWEPVPRVVFRGEFTHHALR